jgi:aconitate hydratase
MTTPAHPFASTLQSFSTASGQSLRLYSLPELAKTYPNIERLPVSMRIVLESVLRNCDGHRITAEHVRQIANWGARDARTEEIPFVVSRVLLQDFTGVPLLVDLAAMRSAAARLSRDPKRIEPLVLVDLVVDHSIMVDVYGTQDALERNMQLEFKRNHERYRFMKWGMQAFDTFRVVPPGFGICHQVNLEYLARGVHRSADGICWPDTLVGTDSHTTMINGIGVVGWGVGGIEAEAAMLGQPVYFLAPDVVGLELTGRLREGVTATDLVLTVTELLRKHKVVGKFVELIGEGTRTLSVPDRATLGNMSPENGATITFFPVDDKTIEYFRDTGRTEAEIEAFAAYYKAQGMYGVPDAADLDYTTLLRLDLASVTPSVAGPRRPQDRIELGRLGAQFTSLFSRPNAEGGFNQAPGKLAPRFAIAHEAHDQPLPEAPALQPGAERNQAEMLTNRPQLPAGHEGDAGTADVTVGHGDVLIAAITSCTNTSNPSVMLAAGLLAKKAVQAGLRVAPHIKTSLAPGSRVVTEYLEHAGLMPYLEQLGFALAGYGCTTCIGNSGDLTTQLNDAIAEHDLVCAAVLSGNRNFEARIHPNLKANFLMSPPLVVAFALAGSVLRDLTNDPIGKGKDGRDVYLRDIWPTNEEVAALVRHAMEGKAFRENYARIASDPGALWQAIEGEAGQTYAWPQSTYIAEPPYFDGFALAAPDAKAGAAPLEGARIMALFGDSITTDHISPAGSIAKAGPAGQWLIEHGVARADFNSYGSRRGHHEVMMRGTFANVRIKNLMLPAKADGSREEGGLTLLQPGGEKMPIFDAAMRYQAAGVPTVVFAGEEYGNGSSRDWAAKGTQLLGIKAVIARSFERIHRSNLVGMGVLPLQFQGSDSWESLGLTGKEAIAIIPDPALRPRSEAKLVIHRADGSRAEVKLTLRIDTPVEADYYRHGGILPYVLRQLLSA